MKDSDIIKYENRFIKDNAHLGLRFLCDSLNLKPRAIKLRCEYLGVSLPFKIEPPDKFELSLTTYKQAVDLFKENFTDQQISKKLNINLKAIQEARVIWTKFINQKEIYYQCG